MQLQLTTTSRISDIQQQFNRWFPFLKLQFFVQPIHSGDTQVKKKLLQGDALINGFIKKQFPMEIPIEGTMTVSDLENYFTSNLGIHVQVFRSSGSLWLITTATDQWSLNKQNSEGEELSKRPFELDPPADIHEQK